MSDPMDDPAVRYILTASLGARYFEDVMFLVEHGLDAPLPSRIYDEAQRVVWEAAHPWRVRLRRAFRRPPKSFLDL